MQVFEVVSLEMREGENTKLHSTAELVSVTAVE